MLHSLPVSPPVWFPHKFCSMVPAWLFEIWLVMDWQHLHCLILQEYTKKISIWRLDHNYASNFWWFNLFRSWRIFFLFVSVSHSFSLSPICVFVHFCSRISLILISIYTRSFIYLVIPWLHSMYGFIIFLQVSSHYYFSFFFLSFYTFIFLFSILTRIVVSLLNDVGMKKYSFI